MTEQEFLGLAAQGYNLIPVTTEALSDLDTPLSVYLKLGREPYSYFLESVVGGERFGRYSFIGLPAARRIWVFGNQVTVESSGVALETSDEADPLAFINDYLKRFNVAQVPGLPRFCGGLVGYFGYDTVRYIERRLASTEKTDPLNLPDIVLLWSTELVVFDNLSGKLYFIVYADPTAQNAFRHAQERLAELKRRLRQPIESPPNSEAATASAASSEFGEENFKAAVSRAKQYIYDGDVMQVVLSQRLTQPFDASPLTLYRALRTLNPSPYMFYYNFEDFHVVGASPEILVRLEQGAVTLRPIAGTRPRGATPPEDEALATELLADPKERAEHVMLMDLGRNDVGRVAQTGSVKVTDNMVIERYSHVMHIVSNVEGKLRPDLNAMDVLRATFPAGTVSGSPKVRAMEIIDELEPTKRGVYAGAVGYLGFNGDMDLAIAIRTAVVKNQMLYVQVGAGIVADSVPQSEWQETENKAKAVLRAAEMALKGLD
ncbi:MAG: anthranilate synthase component I [Burkholderiales bacterium]